MPHSRAQNSLSLGIMYISSFPSSGERQMLRTRTHVGRFGEALLLLLQSEWLECVQTNLVVTRNPYHEVRVMFPISIACAIRIREVNVVGIAEIEVVAVVEAELEVVDIA